VRKEGTSNIAFELTDGVDFVSHLSLLCNCYDLFKYSIAELNNVL